MPVADRFELMLGQIGDAQLLLELLRCMPLGEIAANTLLAMLGMAIGTIKVVGDVTIDAAVDAPLAPGLHYRLPVRIPQASPVLAHLANLVTLLSDRLAVLAAFEELHRIGNRLG